MRFIATKLLKLPEIQFVYMKNGKDWMVDKDLSCKKCYRVFKNETGLRNHQSQRSCLKVQKGKSFFGDQFRLKQRLMTPQITFCLYRNR